jgi:hypothetical protein
LFSASYTIATFHQWAIANLPKTNRVYAAPFGISWLCCALVSLVVEKKSHFAIGRQMPLTL